jgi:hypothetical protein
VLQYLGFIAQFFGKTTGFSQIPNIGALCTVNIDIVWKKMALPKPLDRFIHKFRKSINTFSEVATT